MNKETLKYVLRQGIELGPPDTRPRALEMPLDSRKVVLFRGIRRGGRNSSPYIPASDGNPADDVSDDPLKVWNVTSSTEVRNAIIKWGYSGIEYYSTGPTANHTIRNCRFEQLSEGISISIDPARTVTFIGSEKCSVTQDYSLYQGQQPIGSLTSSLFCNEKGFPGVHGFDSDDRGGGLPDTMAAIGSFEFLEVLNKKIVVFSRSTGARTGETNPAAFFGLPSTNVITDPRVWFDSLDSDTNKWRWVTCFLDQTQGKVVVNVSRSPSANLASTNWRSYVETIPVSTNHLIDFPTLGLDTNGIYFSVQAIFKTNDNQSAGYY